MSQKTKPEAASAPAPVSAQARVLRSYFETTSAAGIGDGEVDYRTLTAGIRRGLGSWLDVAGRTVLDLGCGTGELCWLAVSLGAERVVGVNLSEGELEFARPHVQATFVLDDILAYLTACPDASVDRIFALNILEHLTKDDLVKVLDQARRCLTDGGHLIAMVPNATSTYGAMTRYWDITHHNAFTPSSVRQLMRLCGFAAVEFREWGPTPHGAVSLVRYGLWQVIRGLTWLRLMVEMASGKGGIYTADMLFRLTKRSDLKAK
ncbi:MAG: class I SAM-dependent methyltransferase [Myxococcaceae bacterium]